jgi:hypothetical protein
VKPAAGAVFATCVVLKDNVGSAPPGLAVGRPTVARVGGIFVAEGVKVGAARAVIVCWAEICAMAVPSAAVLMALISTVGAAVAPTLHAVNISVVVSRKIVISFLIIGSFSL